MPDVFRVKADPPFAFDRRSRRRVTRPAGRLEYCLGNAGKVGHTEQVSLKVIITFILGFALDFAAGWYLGASLPHSGR